MPDLKNILDSLSSSSTMFDENSPIGYLSFDAHAHVTQMNAGAARLLGVQRKMFLGMPLPAALAADEIPKFLEHLHRCRAGEETNISTELKLGKRPRAQIPVELATTPTTIHGQRRFPTAIIDLRRQERRLQTMLEAKQLAEHLFDIVSHPLAALNEDLIIEATNSAFREKFRVRASEIQGRSIFELEMIRWHDGAFTQSLRRVVTHRELMREVKIDCSLGVSGERLTLLANAMRLIPRPPARPLVLLTFEDITLRLRHEQEREAILAELQEMNASLEERVRERTAELRTANAQLKTLSRRVVDAHETERRHLSRELHDEIGQALTGLNMLLHRASDDATAEKRAEIREARQVVAELLRRVRQMSIDLRPAVLDDLGLCVAVRSHIDTFSKRTGIRVNLVCDDIDEGQISPEIKITAFRAVQESLTNIVRHARTKSAAVALRGNASRLYIEIGDNGKGFDPLIGEQSGRGLNGMRERVGLAGGQLELESAPGRGTRVLVQLPFRNEGGGKLSDNHSSR